MIDPVVLYDGWALVHQPNSPAALHLLTLLELLPPGIRALVGLPGRPCIALPAEIEVVEARPSGGPWGRLAWEQRQLPALARRSGAAWLHQFSGAALFSGMPGLLSPAAEWERRSPPRGSIAGLPERLRAALAMGGATRSRLAWPVDFLAPGELWGTQSFVSLPPVVLPGWLDEVPETRLAGIAPPDLPDLPESYLLYHGPLNETALRPALQAWGWAAEAIGEYYPLLLLGFEGASSEALLSSGRTPCAPTVAGFEPRRVSALAAEYGLEGSTRLLPPLSLPALARVYRGCSALFHPGEAEAWGDPAVLALACGRPLVGLETPRLAAIAGPAAYLAPAGQPAAAGRLLGAGLISVVVDETLAEALSSQARQRTAPWDQSAFTRALEELYRIA